MNFIIPMIFQPNWWWKMQILFKIQKKYVWQRPAAMRSILRKKVANATLFEENRDRWVTILDLKYTNFHFEDNAAWKMILGIWFVFSKQYSDKLAEDILRWTNSKVEQWKAIWRPKAWYFINDEWFHEPHPKFFPLIQEAFKMKLNWEIESKIKDYLDSNWYYREFKKTWEQKEIARSLLNKMFRDEFYYGMLIMLKTIIKKLLMFKREKLLKYCFRT